MSKLLRVLIVEDSDDDAVLLVRELRRGGYDVAFERVDTPTAMNAALDSGQWDIIIADYSMPHFSAPAALTLLQKERGLDLPFIIVSGAIGEETAVSAMKAGAHDYLMKSNLARLVSTVERELREAEVRLARQQAEEALQRSEQRFRSLVEATSHIVWTNTPAGEMQGSQPGWSEFTGQSEAEYQGYGWASAVHPDEAQTTIEAWQKAVDTRSMFMFEHRLRRYDGQWRTFSIRAIPVVEPDGTTIREWVGVHTDITVAKHLEEERQRAEEALRASEARFRRLSESNIVGVMIANHNGDIQEANDALLKMIGYTQQELVAGMVRWRAMTPPEYLPKDERAITQLNQTGTCAPFEKKYIRKDGSRVPIVIGCALLEGSQDTTICFVLDLTDRKQAEEALQAALKEKEVLLKEIHHRVKNNLQVISSLLNMQSRSIQDKQYLEIFKDSQDRIRAMALIHEKLYQAKDLARINFAGYIRDLAASLFRSYKGKSAAIALKIHIDDVSLSIDAAVPCGLIINELVSNALKHAFRMSNKGEICIELCMNLEHQFVLIVSDNGAGFPINLDFQNTESLGLQLVNTLAAQLRGSVELNSNGGTEFKITFPN